MLYDMASESDYPGPTHPMIGAQLRAASEAVHEALYARLVQAGHDGLRPAHFALLRYPGPHGTRPTELAARVGLRKQALNPLLRDLEEMGYLERVVDADDGRGRILWLTPRGKSLVRLMRETLEEIEQRITDRLGVAGFESFRRALASAEEAANQPPVGHAPREAAS